MSTPVIESPTEAYLAAVDSALADLPATERAELLDDVRQHLAEVAAETGEPLEATLGSPEVYAADLRSAAGLPAAAEAAGATRSGSPAPGWPRDAALRAARTAAGFARSLRPGWWPLRGAVLTTGLLVLLASGRDADRLTGPSALFIALLVVAAVVGACGSAYLGRWSVTAAAGWRALAVAVNLIAVGLVVTTAVQLRDDAHRYVQSHRFVYVTEDSGSPTQTNPGSLTGPNGLVYNIYARDSQGNPLTGVQLFDQNGQPLDIEVGQDADGNPLVRRLPVDTGGHALYNVFPQDQTETNGAGLAAPAITASPVAVGSIAVVPPGPGAPQPVIVGLQASPTANTAGSAAPAATATPVASPRTGPSK